MVCVSEVVRRYIDHIYIYIYICCMNSEFGARVITLLSLSEAAEAKHISFMFFFFEQNVSFVLNFYTASSDVCRHYNK